MYFFESDYKKSLFLRGAESPWDGEHRHRGGKQEVARSNNQNFLLNTPVLGPE